jgi:branched-chain amino acid transport system substrate-binding protein
VPDDVAALTWDSVRLVTQAVQNGGKVESDIRAMRKIVRDQMAAIKEFDGITGKMSFDAEGDPIKCAVVVEISNDAQFVFKESVCPK